MGPGMAVVFAVHGYETRLMDINAEILERAKNAVEVAFQCVERQWLYHGRANRRSTPKTDLHA